MGKDVGRNDPCPCGSGRKYKQCCLRKQKMGGGGPSRKQRSGWRDRYEKAVEKANRMGFGTTAKSLEKRMEAWQLLHEKLPEGVDTLEAAQKRLGDGRPRLTNLTWDLFDDWRNVVVDGQRDAMEAVEFVRAWSDRFAGESGEVASAARAELVFFLGHAGRVDEADKLARNLIDEAPEKASAYCTLADAYMAQDPPAFEKAKGVLEEAREFPVEDADDWDLERRIEEVENKHAMKKARESEHFIEWQDFWDEFNVSPLDKRLEMARERIDNAPDFDGEWLFSLMIDGLLHECSEAGRGSDWLETLDYAREHRPKDTESEAGVMAANALEFTLSLDGEYVDDALEMMLLAPADSPDHLFRSLDLLRYSGITRVLDGLVEKWPEFRDAGGLMPTAYGMWAEVALEMQVAVWAEEDIDEPRSVDDFRDNLGDMMDELDETGVTEYVELALGTRLSGFDAETADQLDDSYNPFDAVTIAFSRHLITEEGWAPSKAFFAQGPLAGFLEHCAKCSDPFQDTYSTKTAHKSRGLRRKLQKLRGLWRDDHRFVPHPDLAVGYTERLSDQGPFGRRFVASAFFESVARMTPWLDARGFVENSELTERVQAHFQRRIPDVTEVLGRFQTHNDQLNRELEQTEEWLRER